MIKQIEFPYRNWTFEVYDSNKDIKSVTPTIFLLAEKMPKGHNSKFPYIPKAGYKTNNPYSTFNLEPTFTIDNDNVILILCHKYQDIDTQLDQTLTLLKSFYKIHYFDCQSGKEI